ncbi:MAG: hypothetical protein QM765_27090 [Myxococcales bacterium]
MFDLARYFEMGGWMMYPLVLVLMLALPSSLGLPIASYVVGKPKLAFLFSMVLAGLGLAAAGLGALGRGLGMRNVEQAIAMVKPVDAAVILTVGRGESRACLAFGLAVAVLPLAAAGVALGRAAGARVSAVAAAGGLALGAGLAALMGVLSVGQFALVNLETSIGIDDARQLPAIAAESARLSSSHLAAAAGVGLPLAAVGAMLLVVAARRAKQAASSGAGSIQASR